MVDSGDLSCHNNTMWTKDTALLLKLLLFYRLLHVLIMIFLNLITNIDVIKTVIIVVLQTAHIQLVQWWEGDSNSPSLIDSRFTVHFCDAEKLHANIKRTLLQEVRCQQVYIIMYNVFCRSYAGVTAFIDHAWPRANFMTHVLLFIRYNRLYYIHSDREEWVLKHSV